MADEVAALRIQLELVQNQAAEEIGQLQRRLQEYDAAPVERDAGSVAHNLAAQQELEALRRALREKERIADQLTIQCHALEDQLEDHYQRVDALRRELRIKETERREAEARAQPGVGARARMPWPPSSARRDAGRFAAGLLVGLLLAVGAGAALRWAGHWPVQERTASGTASDRSPDASVTHAPAAADAGAATPGPVTTFTPPPAKRGQDRPEAKAAGTSALVPAAEPAPTPAPVTQGPHRANRVVQDRNGPPMVAIDAGRFSMGYGGGISTSDTRPAHEVALPGFLIGVREVTFSEYDRYVRATGARRPDDYGWGRAERPVVDVSWYEAVAYTRWLAGQTGRRYRLPTEAEWELAARAGSEGAYWWGNDPPNGRAVCLDCGSAWDRRSTAAVGSLSANAFGLYDTAGNAAEWVADCYHRGYDGAPADGGVWDERDCAARIVRGGSFDKPASSMHSHVRKPLAPDARLRSVGFRVARDAD